MGILCVRADASVAMGTGHVMRCLALAQAWQDAGGDVVFAMAQTGPAVSARLRSENVSVVPLQSAPGSIEDAKETAEVARKRGAAWIVVDGYQFDGRYQEDLRNAGFKVLFVDDSGHAANYAADIVLNQNAHACAEIYASRGAYTRLLLGPRYALLRREFRVERDFQREIPAVGHKVLVTMGGSDPENLTLRVIEALALTGVDNLEATVVVGGSNPHAASLREAAGKSGRNIRLLCDVDKMPEWMKWADVAVSAAGSTCWEMCLLGLPALLIDFAPNQTPVARELDRLGAALHFGDAASVVPKAIAGELQRLMMAQEIRTTMSRKAKELVDGLGAQRVVSALRSGTLYLRPAEESDCTRLWEWANDPVARHVSFSPGTIAWEDHVAWFRQKLGDRNAVLYVAVDDEQSAVGFIRYQIEERRAVVSINVAPRFRGQGYGNVILSLANQDLFQTTDARVVDAWVKTGNDASIRLFIVAGFKRQPDQIVAGQNAAHFTFEKNGLSNG